MREVVDLVHLGGRGPVVLEVQRVREHRARPCRVRVRRHLLPGGESGRRDRSGRARRVRSLVFGNAGVVDQGRVAFAGVGDRIGQRHRLARGERARPGEVRFHIGDGAALGRGGRVAVVARVVEHLGQVVGDRGGRGLGVVGFADVLDFDGVGEDLADRGQFGRGRRLGDRERGQRDDRFVAGLPGHGIPAVVARRVARRWRRVVGVVRFPGDIARLMVAVGSHGHRIGDRHRLPHRERAAPRQERFGVGGRVADVRGRVAVVGAVVDHVGQVVHDHGGIVDCVVAGPGVGGGDGVGDGVARPGVGGGVGVLLDVQLGFGVELDGRAARFEEADPVGDVRRAVLVRLGRRFVPGRRVRGDVDGDGAGDLAFVEDAVGHRDGAAAGVGRGGRLAGAAGVRGIGHDQPLGEVVGESPPCFGRELGGVGHRERQRGSAVHRHRGRGEGLVELRRDVHQADVVDAVVVALAASGLVAHDDAEVDVRRHELGSVGVEGPRPDVVAAAVAPAARLDPIRGVRAGPLVAAGHDRFVLRRVLHPVPGEEEVQAGVVLAAEVVARAFHDVDREGQEPRFGDPRVGRVAGLQFDRVRRRIELARERRERTVRLGRVRRPVRRIVVGAAFDSGPDLSEHVREAADVVAGVAVQLVVRAGGLFGEVAEDRAVAVLQVGPGALGGVGGSGRTDVVDQRSVGRGVAVLEVLHEDERGVGRHPRGARGRFERGGLGGGRDGHRGHERGSEREAQCGKRRHPSARPPGAPNGHTGVSGHVITPLDSRRKPHLHNRRVRAGGIEYLIHKNV